MRTLLLLLVLFGCPGLMDGQKQDPLLFQADNFTTEIRTIQTSAGVKEVTYRSFLHIPYVAKPVDKDYQSMNVFVPVKIDGDAVDAKNVPILFEIGVGGYMSVRNSGGNSKNPGNFSRRAELALAAGYVIVSPGCRGRDNKAADGTFYGKAPAAIVDLKAAVRYIRHNKGLIPGNTDRIFSVGCSAGGALSALLGTSGNSPLFDQYLTEIGAANAPDNIFGSACYSPITDLEHADAAYEWMYGSQPSRSGLVNQDLSNLLKEDFSDYQKSLNLKGKNGFETLSAENYDEYLMKYYLVPSANRYLYNLPENVRQEYLKNNTWIVWTDKGPSFTFPDYVKHAGRMKGLPAFDDFNMKQPEPDLFGNTITPARHFTNFSLQQATGDKNARIDDEMVTVINMMNAMNFTSKENKGCAPKWWLRNGTKDNHTSQTVMVNLATVLEQMNQDVNIALFWDGGHCADDDPEGLISWIGAQK